MLAYIRTIATFFRCRMSDVLTERECLGVEALVNSPRARWHR